MVRPKKVAAVELSKAEDSSPDVSLMVQSRSRRTIKPNPKYNSKEIIPLKRLDGDDDSDDYEIDVNQSTEDDEDFHDDDARDSDADESPRARKRGRGRPPVEAPRSEPQPQRRLQQIRAGLKESTMSTSKLMQKTGIISSSTSLDKKRKIDFDAEEEPNSKRRPGLPSTPTIGTRGGTRLSTATTAVASPKAPATVTGKENAAATMVKKTDGGGRVKLVNVDQIKAQSTATPPPPSGITTRRQQAIVTNTTTPSPKTSVVRSQQVVIGSGSASAKETSSTKSMIQVRRTTPMNSQTSPAAATTTTGTGSTPPAAAVAPRVLNKERVILNRTPAAKPKPAAPVATTSPVTPRPLATRSSAGGLVKGSPSPGTTMLNKTPANRILNSTTAAITLSNSIKAGAAAPVKSDAEQENTLMRYTSLEKRYLLHLAPVDETTATAGVGNTDKPSIPLIQLRNQIRTVSLPTPLWSFQMKLSTARGVRDPSAAVPDKPGYVVQSVTMNRLATPAAEGGGDGETVNGGEPRKFDRSVELLKNHYNVIIDGTPVRLLGAPSRVSNKDDVETLLQIVENVSIESPIVKVVGK